MKTLKIASGVLALVVALVGAGVASAWAPDRPVESLKARWAPSPSQFVALNGMQVHLRDEGPRDDPQPIVLLHGTSASLHTWEGWVAALKGQRRVITVDLPGFGLTGPSPDGDYHLPHYVDFVISVLNHLQLKQVVLGGNSLGGEISWMTAVGHPERVSKLVLVDAAGYPFKPEGMPIGFKVARIPALKPFMTHMLPRHMIESSVRSVYGDVSKVTPALVDRYYELTLREGNRESLTARFSQSPMGAYADQIKQIRQPTLIIWGGQDHLITPDNADKFQRDIQGSRLVVFDKLGHVPQEEDPVATVDAFKAFLAQR